MDVSGSPPYACTHIGMHAYRVHTNGAELREYANVFISTYVHKYIMTMPIYVTIIHHRNIYLYLTEGLHIHAYPIVHNACMRTNLHVYIHTKRRCVS